MVSQGMYLLGRVRIYNHYQQLHELFVHTAVTVIRTTVSSVTFKRKRDNVQVVGLVRSRERER